MNIQRLVLIFVLILACVQWSACGELPAEAKKTQVLMSKVYEAMRKDGMTDARDDRGAMRRIPEFHNLSAQATGIWETVLDNLNAIAPSKSDQVMLLDALSTLPPETYLKAVHKSVDLYKQGDFDGDILTSYFMFNDGPNWGIFEVNYKNPEVVQILNSLRDLFANDLKLANTIDHILSGKGKVTIENNIKNNPDYRHRSINSVLLDKPITDPNFEKKRSTEPVASPKAISANTETSERSDMARGHDFRIRSVVILIVIIAASGIYLSRRKSA